MKKILINIGCYLTLAIMMVGCKSQLEANYVDPDKTTDPSIEKLFSSILDNNRVRPQYWDMRTMTFLMPGLFSQVNFAYNSTTAYQQNAGYSESFWNDYYTPNNQSNNPNQAGSGNGIMAQYRTMQRLYSVLPLDERPNFQVFMMAGKALLLDQTAQMIDLWGDIPYSGAGSLDINNTISNPEFQPQKELYDTVLIGLKDISDYFAAVTLNTNAAASFAQQDFVMKGSIDKWRRFVNSLRLRYLMRTSSYSSEGEARAKAEIQVMFSSPIQYPLLDGDGVGDNYNPGNTDVLSLQMTNYNENLRSAFTEVNAQAAPDYMLNKVMVPADDPRIPLMFDKGSHREGTLLIPNPEYKALPMNLPQGLQSDSITFFASWDSTAYRLNIRLPGIYIAAPEVNFLKAEAFERWGLTGGTAQASYELALRQAVAFQYYLYNNAATKYEALVQPSTAAVTAFLAKPGVNYAGDSPTRLAMIWTQKWLFFNILQSRQAWAEYRRTGYPQLTFMNSGTPEYELPPNRLIYPASEIAYNSSYEKVRAKDTREEKIFWAKIE